jgi:hypothetical protein
MKRFKAGDRIIQKGYIGSLSLARRTGTIISDDVTGNQHQQVGYWVLFDPDTPGMKGQKYFCDFKDAGGLCTMNFDGRKIEFITDLWNFL